MIGEAWWWWHASVHDVVVWSLGVVFGIGIGVRRMRSWPISKQGG